MVDSELDTETIVCPAVSHQTCRTEALTCSLGAWPTVNQSQVSKGTSVVDEQIQSGLSLQEMLTEAVDGLQVGQVQLHVRHVAASCFLSGRQEVLSCVLLSSLPSSCSFSMTGCLCSTCWMSAMAAWALLRFRQARITLAPLLAKCSAVALPIPVFPPKKQQLRVRTATQLRSITAAPAQRARR